MKSKQLEYNNEIKKDSYNEKGKMCFSEKNEVGKMCSLQDNPTCGECGVSTQGKIVKILDFREGNEESSGEARAEKARVYKEFDDCTRTGNLVEILRFTHFSRIWMLRLKSNR